MKLIAAFSFFAVLAHIGAGALMASPGPYDGKKYVGRIAYSADGNDNDEDDWAASPVALAIFANFGVKDRLVHFDYNSILGSSRPEWEKQHETSILEAAARYRYPKSIFHNVRRNRDAAIESIARAINESSAENPLYFILAGPMEVPYLGVQKSDPAKRRFVYCISHSRWNEGFSSNYTYPYNKRSVIPSGIRWIQIKDQNSRLATSPFGRPATPAEWTPWLWMKDSRNRDVQFLWERLRATTRADCSDAGMAYFLATGNEDADIPDLRRLLEHRSPQAPVAARQHVRLEAENFITLENSDLRDDDRAASHQLSVRLKGAGAGSIRTPFDEPYTAGTARYDLAVRYFDGNAAKSRLSLSVNGKPAGQPWHASSDDNTWKVHTIHNVAVATGDEIAIEVQGDGSKDAELDYVQLNLRTPLARGSNSRFTARGPLDDPRALPGQLIVAGSRPGYLKYNGGGPAYLAGPDNPEAFLYLGTRNADGTRSGGEQEEIIERMARAGVSAFHCLVFRAKQCNIKAEGDDSHVPFIDHDPAKPLDEGVLRQWEGWLSLLEKSGIAVHLEFYNDATDVERMGWVLDARGNLHPDEERFITGIVKRFKHHKNILWSIEESANKLPAGRTAHFKKIGEVIARTDNHRHPIMQSFVVPNDPEGDFPDGGVMSDAYNGDPNIRVVSWLHVVPHGDDLEKAHKEYLRYYKESAGNFVVMKNETFYQDYLVKPPLSRQYMWAAAMARLHSLEAQHYANRPDHVQLLRDDGLMAAFMERTDFYRMTPNDDLAAGSTKWVLANSGESYIAYTYAFAGSMGLKGIAPGAYDLVWYDTASGDTVTQNGVSVAGGGATWEKPTGLGNEVALYLKRNDSPRRRSK